MDLTYEVEQDDLIKIRYKQFNVKIDKRKPKVLENKLSLLSYVLRNKRKTENFHKELMINQP